MSSPLLYTAFLVGLMGSLHCVGMCGPIALALPSQRRHPIAAALLYQLGRTLTYSLLGAVLGVMGLGLSLASSQQWLSIGTGLLLLAVVLWPGLQKVLNQPKAIAGKGMGRLRRALGSAMKRLGLSGALLTGLLNGLLPCGLVYVAMAGALATGKVAHGMAYMALFGLGTWPLMLAVALGGAWLKPKLGIRAKTLLRPFTIVLACLFIIRGLSLGIPYLSPHLPGPMQAIEETTICGS